MVKQYCESVLRSIFSVAIMIAIAGGVVVAVLFVAALAMGGKEGQKIAVDTGRVYLPFFIRAAAIAVMSGLLVFYIRDAHELSLDAEAKAEKGDRPIARQQAR